MIEFTIFICGAFLMILEIVGSRLLAPQVGTSIHVWTSLIGVILASLSAGYWYGGRLADRSCTPHGLAKLLATSGGLIACSFILSPIIRPVLPLLTGDLRLQAVLGATALFAAPSLLLGMISPYSIRLRLTTIASSGATVGTMYAISTAGSILGTFLGGFVLIAWLSTNTIFFGLAIGLLCLATIIALTARAIFLAVMAALASIVLTILKFSWQEPEKALALIDTPYASYRVVEREDESTAKADKLRLLMSCQRGAQSSVDASDPSRITYPPAIFMLDAFTAAEIRGKTLLLGGAPFVTPSALIRRNPSQAIDIVEIDRALLPVAQKFFHFAPSPFLSFFFEDGRTFLNRVVSDPFSEKYEAIIVDVFGASYNPPFHIMTREAFRQMHSLLAAGGWLMVNTVSAVEGTNGALLRSAYRTIASVFDEVKLFPEYPTTPSRLQNVYILARDGPILEKVGDHRGLMLFSHEIAEVVLTDDYAPVEEYLREAQLNPD